MSCTYTYPSRIDGGDTKVKETFWFTKERRYQHVDLKTDSDYQDRVEYSCSEKSCTLRITDLRESDSAAYKFRFITNQPGGRYTGSPGVTLRVTGNILSHTVIFPNLKCHSSCRLPDHSSYIWYKNGQKVQSQTSSTYSNYFNSADSYSCAVEGHEDFLSPPVYAPKLPSVSVSPSAEIVEDSSVTLTCSSDANPAANYTWYKEEQKLLQSPEGSHYLTSVSSEDGGNYSCKAQNQHGQTSSSVFIDVQCESHIPPKSYMLVLKLISMKRKKQNHRTSDCGR
uniref:B-cell receptor CD22 n=1 Tax=Sparus aurata TaxID=8175 RepID=A0A671TGX7_SPAAU